MLLPLDPGPLQSSRTTAHCPYPPRLRLTLAPYGPPLAALPSLRVLPLRYSGDLADRISRKFVFTENCVFGNHQPNGNLQIEFFGKPKHSVKIFLLSLQIGYFGMTLFQNIPSARATTGIHGYIEYCRTPTVTLCAELTNRLFGKMCMHTYKYIFVGGGGIVIE